METMMQNIDLNNLDKSTWETFKFEEIAQKISKTVKPDEAEVDIYVGLEHIDAEDIHIRRNGVPSDVKGGKLRCYPGDVIFGKRRAYQRKAAIVDFDGICSAHAFVFRANPEIIDPKLFPFFLHSDQFMYRMVDISVGGLSPTINWGDLKHQEFLLPPKDQQAKLAKLLWAMDEVIERENSILDFSIINKKAIIKDYLSKSEMVKRVDELGTVVTGNTPSTKEDKYWGGDTPFISPADINDSPYVNKTVRYLTESGKTKSRIFPANSILTVCIGSTIGKVAINSIESCSNQQINALIPKDDYDSIYLLYLLRYFKSKIIARTGATAVPIINKTEFSSIKLPILSSKFRTEFVKKIRACDYSISELIKVIDTSKSLQKSLINQVF